MSIVPPQSSALPDFDLTCWYLNRRRVVELLGSDTLAPQLDRVGRMGGHAHLQDMAIEGVFKDAITGWLMAQKPPTLGELLVSEKVAAGQIFTHYTNWFFKGLGEARKAQMRGTTVLPPALAYAKLDTLRPGGKVECRFHAEHLTSNSSWSELSGQATKFVLALITRVQEDVIEAIPYVIADIAPSYDRPASLIGRHWNNKLEVFVEQIDSFSAIETVEKPRRKTDLEPLRAIPEASVKQAFAEILGEPIVPKDWGGERSDFYTTRLLLYGQRISTAFALKGPAKFKPMTMAELGKNGDQIDRLFTEPAELVVLQHCHEITGPVRGVMRAYAQRIGDLRLFCLIDGYDTLQILRAYGKCGLSAQASTVPV
jgi:hypothetical protein